MTANATKTALMHEINAIRDSSIERYAGNDAGLEMIAKIMAALEAKDDAFWARHNPLKGGTFKGDAGRGAWKEVAAEVIKG